MATLKVRLLVAMSIHEGQFDAFNRIAQEMIAGSSSETGTLDYEWYLSADRRHCRLVETYSDSAAMAKHFAGPVVQQLVPRMAEHCKIDRIEVYGNLDPDSSRMLTDLGAEIFVAWQGLDR